MLRQQDKNVIFVCKGNKKATMHLSVLAARSSVFARMLSDQTIRDNHEVDTSFFELYFVSKFILFLRTGMRPRIDNVEGFLYLAQLYGVNSLIELCENHLVESLNKGNALNAIKLANDYNLKCCLKRRAFEIIKREVLRRCLPDALMFDYKKLKEIVDRESAMCHNACKCYSACRCHHH